MRFYTTATNSRNKEIGIGGSATKGQEVHTRGWRAGVRVNSEPEGRIMDKFEIYMTSGSNGSSDDILIGTVESTSDGPKFTPNKNMLMMD